MDYSKTLNLPVTDFPMRANLPAREPEFLDYWQTEGIYEQKRQQREGAPKFVLHDGPPYANGNIHLGHALNKILKDVINKYKFQQGYDTPYVPGWDTHGMPIEHAAINNLKLNRHELDPLVLRQECHDYALGWIDKQRADFKRLGVLADWDNPYITLRPAYEAEQIKVFGEMAKKGYIYKGLKAVYWCTHCETALAEAEIEYGEEKSPTIYVKFALKDDKGLLPRGIDPAKAYAVIWTTTPWTLPANVAIAVHPKFEYSWVACGDEVYLLATDLVAQVAEASGKEMQIIASTTGKQLEGLLFCHPFMDRDSVVVLADYVTADTGTGCVHTAPGHGPDDFETGMRYKLPVISPVDQAGVLTKEAGPFAGMFVFDANGPIISQLAHSGHLLAKSSIRHQYAHCWRCKKPIIYRATEQWFASVDGFRDEALESIDKVQWIPSWGRDRIHNMVADRHDWCISRQRVWGVPIPIFYCQECNEPIVNDDTINAVSTLFAKEGSDAWWVHSAEKILPAGTKCAKCGHTHFRKETDIMDVWFDSGSSHRAVLKQRKELQWPASMYLEGSDQHRGWFQSSLLTSVATVGRAPYDAVLTHGFVVDGEGKKMSKSVGNVVLPQEVIKQYGAELLRLWVASADYKADIRISKDILKQLSEVYRKIRNTFRYMLSNLYDFDVEKDSVSLEQMGELDRWALLRLEEVKQQVKDAYESYEYHLLYHAVHNLCAVDLSAVYLDIIKDRLYASKPEDPARRAAQTVMYQILETLVVIMAPVLSFTTEETWQYMKKPSDRLASVQLMSWPKPNPTVLDAALGEKWDKILTLRDAINKVLEVARRNKVIGHSLDANVVVYASGESLATLKAVDHSLASLLIVSQATIEAGSPPADAAATEEPTLFVSVSAAPGEKCERCCIYSDTVGESAAHPTLCARCAAVLES